MAWRCPSCDRQFRRTNQGHECAPAMTIDEYFETGPPHERPIFEVVMEAVAGLEPLHVEPVSVGIFFKKASQFAQLRPKTKWSALGLGLSAPVSHPRLGPKVQAYGGRYWHVFNLRSPDDLDGDIVGWLHQAHAEAPD